MWLDNLLSDPTFYIAVVVFILVIGYFVWKDRKEKEEQLQERLRRLEEQQKANQKS